MKKAILFGSKAVISAALFWFVLRHIDVAHDFEQIQRASAALLIAATLLCVVAVCLQAWRWQLILEIGGKTYALTRLISHTFTGMFFNQALPSSVGGDAIRVWLILRDGAPPSLAIRSVLIERGLGLLALIALSSLGLPTFVRALGLPPLATWGLELGVLAGLALTVVALRFLQRSEWLARFRLGRGIRAMAIDTLTLLGEPWKATAFVLVVLLGQFLGCAAVWLLASAIGRPIALIDTLIVLPTVFLLVALPISIAGWGVREGAMLVGLGQLAVPASDAVLISILFGLIHLAIGLAAGAIWATTRQRGPSMLAGAVGIERRFAANRDRFSPGNATLEGNKSEQPDLIK